MTFNSWQPRPKSLAKHPNHQICRISVRGARQDSAIKRRPDSPPDRWSMAGGFSFPWGGPGQTMFFLLKHTPAIRNGREEVSINIIFWVVNNSVCLFWKYRLLETYGWFFGVWRNGLILFEEVDKKKYGASNLCFIRNCLVIKKNM